MGCNSSQFEGLIYIVRSLEKKGLLCPSHSHGTQHRTGRNKGSQLSKSFYLLCVGLELPYLSTVSSLGPFMVFVTPEIIVLFHLLVAVYERPRRAPFPVMPPSIYSAGAFGEFSEFETLFCTLFTVFLVQNTN